MAMRRHPSSSILIPINANATSTELDMSGGIHYSHTCFQHLRHIAHNTDHELKLG